MNLPIPKLGTVNRPGEISDKFFKGFTHIALPIKAKETKTEPEIEIVLSKKITKSSEAIFSISFLDEIKKSGGSVTAKAGEVIEIPVLQTSGEVVRILLVGVGESSNSLLIRRNSQSGALEALNKSGSWGGLNSVLHSN